MSFKYWTVGLIVMLPVFALVVGLVYGVYLLCIAYGPIVLFGPVCGLFILIATAGPLHDLGKKIVERK